MDELDILARLQQVYPRLRGAKQRIARFLIERVEQASYSPARKVAEAAATSESSVVRFAAEIGFDGYGELQQALQQVVLGRLSMAERLAHSEDAADSTSSLLRDLLDQEVTSLQAAFKQNPPERFEQVVEWLLAARRIAVVGMRTSGALASMLGMRLNELLGNARVLAMGAGDLPDQVRDLMPDDVVIGIGFPRYFDVTIRVMDFARRRGCRVMGITNSMLSPVAKASHLSFLVGTAPVSFARSDTTSLAIINALVALTARRAREKGVEKLGELEELFNYFRLRHEESQ